MSKSVHLNNSGPDDALEGTSHGGVNIPLEGAP